MASIRVRKVKRTPGRTRSGRSKASEVILETADDGTTDATDDGDGGGAAAVSGAPTGAEEAPIWQAEGTPPQVDDDDAAELTVGSQRVRELDPNARGSARGKGKKAPERPPRPPSQESQPKGLEAAGVRVLIQLVEGVTTSSMGEQAAFNKRELDMIEPALARIISRMSPARAKVFGSVADPVLLATGLFIWFNRVRQLQPVAARPSTPGREPLRPNFQAPRNAPASPPPAPAPEPPPVYAAPSGGFDPRDAGKVIDPALDAAFGGYL